MSHVLYERGNGAGTVPSTVGSAEREHAAIKAALHILKERGHERAVRLLTDMPFGFFERTDDFGGDLNLELHALLPVRWYDEIGNLRHANGGDGLAPFREIARSFTDAGYPLRSIAVHVERPPAGPAALPEPTLTASQTVQQALQDVQVFLHEGRPNSAVDRAHTALHGYMRAKCSEIGASFSPEDAIGPLWKTLRAKHPKLAVDGPRPDEINKIVRSLGGAVDALGTLRNHASLSHANEELLPPPEAILVVNVVRTLLFYMEAKFAAP